jgi:hypothetical protein
MVAKTGRLLTVFGATLILFAGLRPAECEAWSLLHPLTFDSTPETKPRAPVLKTAEKTPSTFDQIAAAPGKLATKVGDTITGKKAEPAKPPATMYARPKPPVMPPKKASSSWVPSWLQPAEPAKPKSVPDWMGKPRVDP